jgi:uncharacterized protein involved in exopolysaccharide biosynthesis
MENNLGLREILGLLFKHKYKMLAVFLVTVLASFAIVMQSPQYYSAKAIIMVNFGREFVPISEVGDMRLPPPSQEAIISTEMQLITGRDLADKVMTDVGLEKLYPGLGEKNSPATRELALQEFSKKLHVTNVSRSNLLEIEFRHEDPRMASQTLAVLLDCLKERHLRVFSTVNSGFLEEQLKSYKEKLQNSQRALGKFRQEHQLASEGQGDLLVTKRVDLESTLTQDTSRLAELQEKLAFLKSRPGVYFTANSELRNQLNLLHRKEQELVVKYRDESPPLVTVRDDIRLVEKQLKEQEENMRNTECFKVESETRPLQLKIDAERRQMQQVDSRTLTFGKNTVQLEDLKREVAANEVNYSTYLKKVEEARISENMDERRMTNITIVQRPSVPTAPVVLNEQKILRGGLLAAIMLSLGVGFCFEYLPQTFSTPESVERKLRIPLLAALEHRKE